MPSTPAPPPLLVACLCAQWCGSCRDYRATFEQVAQAFPAHRFVWIDIEDQAEWVDPIEVENFPTLLIAAGAEPRFFGPVMPHRDSLLRLLRAQAATGPALTDAGVRALVTRLNRLAGRAEP